MKQCKKDTIGFKYCIEYIKNWLLEHNISLIENSQYTDNTMGGSSLDEEASKIK